MLILSSKHRIVRRNQISCAFDEIFLTRDVLQNLDRCFIPGPILLSEDAIYQPPVRLNLRRGSPNQPKQTSDNIGEIANVHTRSTPSSQGVKSELDDFKNGKTKQPDPNRLKDVIGREDKQEWLNSAIKEVNTLRENNTFKLIKKSEIPNIKTKNIIPSRFVFVTKRSGLKKGRLVAGGHRQKDSIYGNYNSNPSISQITLRLILSIISKKKWHLQSIDFDAA